MTSCRQPGEQIEAERSAEPIIIQTLERVRTRKLFFAQASQERGRDGRHPVLRMKSRYVVPGWADPSGPQDSENPVLTAVKRSPSESSRKPQVLARLIRPARFETVQVYANRVHETRQAVPAPPR